MLGKQKLLLVGLLALAACGSPQYEAEVTRRRLISWIDDREFQRVLSFLEFEATEAEREGLRSIEAMANMGLGGFEMMALMEDIKGTMNYQRPAFKAMSTDCPEEAQTLKKMKSVALRCIIVRFFNALPDARNKNLIRARELWRHEIQNRKTLMSRQDHILATTLEASMIMSRTGKILADYYELSVNPIEEFQVDGIFAEISAAGKDAKDWLTTSGDTVELLNRRFLGSTDGPKLFDESLVSKIEFAKETGIPKLLQIADMENTGAEERVSRMIIIDEMDLVLEKYFKVKF